MASPSVRVTAYGRTDVGRVRATNEDAFVIADLMVSLPIHAMDRPVALDVGDRGTLLAVSDGMGGAQAGEVASALVLHSLRRGMTTGQVTSAEATLQASVERANERVFAAAHHVGREGMGATVTAVLIHGNRAYIAEVGDSRAYLLRGSNFIPLTHDQSYVQQLVDAGAITREQVASFPGSNLILQAVGTKPTVVVAMTRVTLRKKDRILLCSDGLSGLVTDAEMQSYVAGRKSVDAACKALVDLANSRGGSDNITVMVAEVDGDGLPASVAESRVSLEVLQEFRG
jgi:serine/threonine protein phosphatase PrpC